MNQKSLRVLEFNKIIELLKSKASSSLGLKYIEELVPSSDFEEVKYMQQYLLKEDMLDYKEYMI